MLNTEVMVDTMDRLDKEDIVDRVVKVDIPCLPGSVIKVPVGVGGWFRR
jgi:hypothetical protein